MGAAPERLRRGWTTGTCATAAAKAAFAALVTGRFPDPVAVTLPKGGSPAFALAHEGLGAGFATAGVIKDAGDDPDVTHGALVVATVKRGAAGSGVVFRAGEGVGTVTLPGLPVAPGEPAINPVPRAMIEAAIGEVAGAAGVSADAEVEIAIPGGEALAARTWNPRLGIVGGLSILGTTGIVVPYSCSAWIHSIRSGIDVARAAGLSHVGAATGATSEAALARHRGLAGTAVIDMGDFAGGLLKYLRAHPVPRLTLAGGFAKLTKLGQGLMDLHSGRGEVDYAWLAERLAKLGAAGDLSQRVRAANTANQALALAEGAGLALGDAIAEAAAKTALGVLKGAPVDVEVLVVARDGHIAGRAPFRHG